MRRCVPPIADVSDDANEDGGSSSSSSVAASAASAPLRVNPRARFIADLYTRVAEARALAAETDTADKALEYHARVHVPKPCDSSYKYAQEIDSDQRRKAEMDREYDAKRGELAERAREALKREEQEKERAEREWHERMRREAAEVVTMLKEKVGRGELLTKGESEQLEEAMEEEAREAKAEQEAASCRGHEQDQKAEAAEVEACSDEMARAL